MDIDKFYRIIGASIKRVYGYYITRTIQRFNVDNKAEKVLEKQLEIPRTAPRHEGTDQLFKQIAEANPKFRLQLEERREDLLSRLKSVKVVSKDIEMSEEELKEMELMKEKVRNRLPQSREGSILPMHAFFEPENVPKGRISLFGAIDFMGKHHKSPEDQSSEKIAKQTNMKVEDVDNILNYFKPFYKSGGESINKVQEREMIGYLSLDRITTFLKPQKSVSNERIEAKSDDSSNSNQDSKQVNEKKDQSV